MARPIKHGLDYFPMDVETDDKVELIEAKHGLEGFAVLIKLYQRIYKNGYYIQLSDDLLFIIAKRLNIDRGKLSNLIDDMCNINLFDKQLYESKNILTSTGIQKRFFESTKKRTNQDFNDKIVFSEIMEVFSEKTNVNSEKTIVNSEISTQRKEKKSKVKKSISDGLNFFEFKEDIFVQFFNDNCGMIPKIVELTDDRREKILFIMESGKEKKDIMSAIKKAGKSFYLQGQNETGFKATIDWMLKYENFLKILEGSFDNPKMPRY